MVRTFHASIGDQNLLQKKIVRNPRYANVESRLDTGASLTRHQRRVDDIQENFKIRPNEIFKRVKLSSLAELVLQVGEQDRLESLEPAPQNGNGATAPPSGPQRSYTQLSDVICGVGARDLTTKPETGDTSQSGDDYNDCPYLLLDCQSEAAYEKCHIRNARHFDGTTLNRVMNPYSKELRDYINKEGKIIVIYDDIEEHANKIVTNLTERGFTNVFLLSGGLKLIARRGLHSLVTGAYPRTCFTEDIQKAANSYPKRGFIAPGPGAPQDPDRRKFSEGELAQLRYQLDQYLQDNCATSYMPRRSTTARSTVSRASVSTTSNQKGWR